LYKKKCHVNKREIEFKNRPVFALFSKLNSLRFIKLLRYFAPHCIIKMKRCSLVSASLENGWTDLANSFFKMFVIVLIGFLSKKIGKVARKIGKFRIVKISQFDVCNKARPILTDFKRCTKCCLAINHQLFQKVTAQIPSNFTLNF
jgi:hypothetical protein